MILRRLSQSLKEQNWTAIWIEFILLVAGVFLGIQVANWNAARVDASRATAYLERIRDDINADLSNYQDRISFWNDVSAYGAKGLAFAETGDAKNATQWDLLLAYFQSSQVAEFYTTDATFEELKSAGELGLIKDTRFRYELSQYYSLGFNPLLTQKAALSRACARHHSTRSSKLYLDCLLFDEHVECPENAALQIAA